MIQHRYRGNPDSEANDVQARTAERASPWQAPRSYQVARPSERFLRSVTVPQTQLEKINTSTLSAGDVVEEQRYIWGEDRVEAANMLWSSLRGP
jgi:hypothetical protein